MENKVFYTSEQPCALVVMSEDMENMNIHIAPYDARHNFSESKSPDKYLALYNLESMTKFDDIISSNPENAYQIYKQMYNQVLICTVLMEEVSSSILNKLKECQSKVSSSKKKESVNANKNESNSDDDTPKKKSVKQISKYHQFLAGEIKRQRKLHPNRANVKITDYASHTLLMS